MAEVKNFNQVGTVTKIKEKTGTSGRGSWRMLTIGIKYVYHKKTTVLYCKTFGIKEGLPLEVGDTINIKGGILYNNSYKKGEEWVNNIEVDCNHAGIINESEHVVLQAETDVPVGKSANDSSAEVESADVPF